MKTVIIVQARMTSSRLPGKVLKRIMGKCLLEYQIERLRRVSLADETVIATTINDADIPIVELCQQLTIPFFRGSENDVLARYYNAALRYNADIIARVTSDCPLIDPIVIDKVIGFFKDNYNIYDYVSNVQARTYPRGMDCEVFSSSILNEIFHKASKHSEREHVTPYIYNHPEHFRMGSVAYSEDQSHHRWTVDTQEDFILIKNILENIYPKKPAFTFEDCLLLIGEHPEWAKINAHIEQRKCGV
ncbi:MAG: glycosyltransferase family protein [candidate division Zixibacteria bacterium]|nr:glycosyltransferase family protein [candidate division Zixibacteria bacterium]